VFDIITLVNARCERGARVTKEELDTLTPQQAEAVAMYRESRGEFRGWGDLLRIYGVAGRKIAAVKNRLAF